MQNTLKDISRNQPWTVTAAFRQGGVALKSSDTEQGYFHVLMSPYSVSRCLNATVPFLIGSVILSWNAFRKLHKVSRNAFRKLQKEFCKAFRRSRIFPERVWAGMLRSRGLPFVLIFPERVSAGLFTEPGGASNISWLLMTGDEEKVCTVS